MKGQVNLIVIAIIIAGLLVAILGGAVTNVNVTSSNITLNETFTNNQWDNDLANIFPRTGFPTNVQIPGNVTIGGGFGLGGITLQDNGDLFLNGSLFVIGNISNVNVSDLAINGSLLPVFDATYDIGSPVLRWRNLFLSGDATIGGNISAANINATNIIVSNLTLPTPCGFGSVQSAEEGSSIDAGIEDGFQWSMGDGVIGSNGTAQACGGFIRAISLTCRFADTGSTGVVNMTINGANTDCSIQTPGISQMGVFNTTNCNDSFVAGDLIGPRTTVSDGDNSQCRISWWVQYAAP